MSNISIIRKKNLLYLSIVLFLCPILSFPFIIHSILKKYCNAYYLLAIFMGLVSVLWPPTADLYRHNMMYFDFKVMNLQQFLNYIDGNVDLLYYILLYFFAKMGINFELIRFLFVCISYCLSFNIYAECMKRNPNIHVCHKAIFFLFYLSVPFFTITQGLRYGLAISLFAYGAFFYFYQNRIKWLIYIVIACFIHFSMFPVLLILLLVRCNIKISTIHIFVFILLSLLLIKGELLAYLIEILPINEFLKIRIGYYVNGYWSNEFLDEFSLENKISRYLAHFMMYPLLLFSFYLNGENKYNQFVKFLILIVGVCYLISLTMFFRISLLFILVSLYAFAAEFGKYKHTYVALKIILICGLLSFSSQIYKFRREATISREYLLVYPLPFSLFNSFDYYWIENNISGEGAGKSLKY